MARRERSARALGRRIASKKKSESLTADTAEGEVSEQEQADVSPQPTTGDRTGHWWEGGKQVQAKDEFLSRRLDTPLDKLTRKASGRRSQTLTDRKRGRYIRAQPAGERRDDIAFDATFRAAAPFQQRRSHENMA